MAKRKASSEPEESGGRVVSKQQDKKPLGKIADLASRVVKASLALEEPTVGVPLRTIGNTTFDKKRRILEMGDAQQSRELFNFGQSRKFMQTMLLANGCKDLIQAEKTLSLRGMYYKTLHSIPGTK